MTRRPMSLQTRLMTAVIGFVSLILVIVAVITSATLGSTLEDQLDNKVKSYAATIRDRIVEGSRHPRPPSTTSCIAWTPCPGCCCRSAAPSRDRAASPSRTAAGR